MDKYLKSNFELRDVIEILIAILDVIYLAIILVAVSTGNSGLLSSGLFNYDATIVVVFASALILGALIYTEKKATFLEKIFPTLLLGPIILVKTDAFPTLVAGKTVTDFFVCKGVLMVEIGLFVLYAGLNLYLEYDWTEFKKAHSNREGLGLVVVYIWRREPVALVFYFVRALFNWIGNAKTARNKTLKVATGEFLAVAKKRMTIERPVVINDGPAPEGRPRLGGKKDKKPEGAPADAAKPAGGNIFSRFLPGKREKDAPVKPEGDDKGGEGTPVGRIPGGQPASAKPPQPPVRPATPPTGDVAFVDEAEETVPVGVGGNATGPVRPPTNPGGNGDRSGSGGNPNGGGGSRQQFAKR